MSEITVVSTPSTETATAEKSAEVAKVTPKTEKSETPELVAQDAVETDEDIGDGPENEEGEDEGSKDAAQAKAKKSGSQRRKEKIERLEREVAFLRETAQRQYQPPQAVAEKPTESDSDAPMEGDFDNHIDFVKATARWEARQEFAQAKTKEREDQTREQADIENKAFISKVNAFAEKHTDYFDVVDDVAGVVMPVGVYQAFKSLDNGLEVFYDLAKNNQEEYRRICSLDYGKAMLALGKHEAKLEAKNSSPSQEIKTTRAPAPITPVGSKSSGAVKKSIYDKNLSQAEFEALYLERQKLKSAMG